MTKEFNYNQEVKRFKSINDSWTKIIDSTNDKESLIDLSEELKGRIVSEKRMNNILENEDVIDMCNMYIMNYTILYQRVINKIK
jgi:hypothetical protein